MSALVTEYYVRRDDETLVECAGVAEQRAEIAELLTHGRDGQACMRVVSPLVVDDVTHMLAARDVARAVVLDIAQREWEGELPFAQALDDLAPYAPGLNRVGRAERLVELRYRLAEQARVDLDDYDKQAWTDEGGIFPGHEWVKATCADRVKWAANKLIVGVA